ncbi:hypothetical protein ACH41E_06410 [Streptomyces sp. NPDC020412]|uniref:hypothetical protein n=1 Tax=Streptomyces sp. NPDC020412 TaxID=3365073 RepID=UPI0037AC2923
MHLIHAAFRPLVPDAVLPPHPSELFLSAARPDERVEHVVTHPHARPHPVIGVFLLADSLDEAESRAEAFLRRVLTTEPSLTAWELVSATVPLMTPLYERLLSSPGLAGQNRPRPIPST